MENVKLWVATKGFIEYEGKILVVRESSRYDDGVHASKYDTPGGRIEPGQTLVDALKREIKEETGLDVKNEVSFFANESWPIVRGEQWQIVRIFFRCEALSDQVRLSDDHDEYLWISPADYKKHDLIENLYPAFEAYLK